MVEQWELDMKIGDLSMKHNSDLVGYSRGWYTLSNPLIAWQVAMENHHFDKSSNEMGNFMQFA